jgi:hypothetical protein
LEVTVEAVTPRFVLRQPFNAGPSVLTFKIMVIIVAVALLIALQSFKVMALVRQAPATVKEDLHFVMKMEATAPDASF